MTIKVGDRLPDGKLMESTEFDSGTHCAMPPKEVSVGEAVKAKKIAVFGLPGAYTPTCSAKHVPGYVQNFDQLKKKGVSEEPQPRGSRQVRGLGRRQHAEAARLK